MWSCSAPRRFPITITLRSGEFMRIDYVGTVPPNLRGRVRIDAVDMDAPAMLVQLSTPGTPGATQLRQPALWTVLRKSTTAAASAPAPVTTLSVRADDDPNRQVDGRLSFFEPDVLRGR